MVTCSHSLGSSSAPRRLLHHKRSWTASGLQLRVSTRLTREAQPPRSRPCSRPHACTCCRENLFPLASRYQGPYPVLQKGPKCFWLAMGSSVETVSVDRLKPHYGKAPVTVAQPPCQGRLAAQAMTPELQGAVISTSHTWAEVVERCCGQPY
jgi:hypothetical protein